MSAKRTLLITLTLMASLTLMSSCGHSKSDKIQPLAYSELRLGSIKPEGWLRETLLRQRNGMTSQMDSLYPEVMGPRNGWLGGDGDQWERGPYWIDGLIPMAWILDDDVLKQKAQPWVEWALASQKEDGFFGPDTDYPYERGLQRDNAHDWWPRMVVLKFMQQYWSATGDSRVIDFMRKYFRYQLNTLPTCPLGNWTSWATYRACDNLSSVIWLYRLTGEEWLLDLAATLHEQSHDYVHMFLETDELSRLGTIHCVNLAQGIKEPIVWWQCDPQPKYLDAVHTALADIRKYNGVPSGMYGGDELLHGNNPTQGSELCTAVELMFSLEEMTKITGDLSFVDHLERIAFNALPTQLTDDFMARQYFQQANQVDVSHCIHNFDISHGESDLVYGLLTGYPCCTSNFHQGWPKFVQNLWYSTPDGGLAALAYSPCRVTAQAGGQEVTIEERTRYPMEGNIKLLVSLHSPASFPLHLRIPSWTENASVTVNGSPVEASAPGSVTVISREWSDGDIVELSFPMKITTDTWYENSISVERGPLVYALEIQEEWVRKDNSSDPIHGEFYWEVHPKSPWNYGLVDFDDPEEAFDVTVDERKLDSYWYWNLESAPIVITAKAKRIPYWTLYNGMTGPIPYSRMYGNPVIRDKKEETIRLIPYGCTTLRISEFPVIFRK